ncbi:Gfo/Idh/MocA family oxidoreductase [Candidatus Woesearchaeota archaeon]|nr:Gfo/Idh/MocA family oxidoreductase [Candidatus Woesearchaeota archaeon]
MKENLPQNNALVIGVGSIGLRHAQNLKAKNMNVFLFDVDAEKARNAAGRYGFTFVEGITPEELKRQKAVFICTPTNYHIAPAKAALSAGCDVFIEKPIAVNTSPELEEIRIIAEEKENITLIGCNMRFHPAIQELRRVLSSEELGKIYSVHVYVGQYLPFWRTIDYRQTYSAKAAEGGGMLLEGIHEFDYLCWLFGKVEGVSATIAKVSDLEIDAEDLAEITLKFKTGILAQLHFDCLQKTKRRGYEVVGEKKTITWESIGNAPEKTTIRIFGLPADPLKEKELIIDPNYMYTQELDYFLSCVEKYSPTMNDIANSISTLKLVEAAKQSARDKRTISINHVDR